MRPDPLDQFGFQGLCKDLMTPLRQVKSIVQERLIAGILSQQRPTINYANIRAAGKITNKVTAVTTSPRIRQKVVKYKGGENNRVGAE